MAAVSNSNANKIYIGEVKIINSAITDSAGDPVLFTTLTASTVKVFDILGNVIEPVISQGITVNDLTYEVDTSTLREGAIKAQLELEYPNALLASGTAKDTIIQTLFTLNPKEA